MINEFDQSQGQNYVSNFVPLPLDNLTRMAAMKQGQYDNALDDIEKTKGLLQLKADPNNINERNIWLKNTNKAIDDFSSKALNGWTPQLQREWLSFKNSKINDPDRLNMEESYNQYQNYLKDYRELTKDGSIPLNNTYEQVLNERQNKKNGVIPFYHNGLIKKLDWEDAARKTVNDLKEEGLTEKGYVLDPVTQQVITWEQGDIGITPDRLMKEVNMKYNNFLTSDAGKQYEQQLKSKNPNATNEQIENQIKNFIYAANSNKVGIKSTKAENVKKLSDNSNDSNPFLNGFGLGQTKPNLRNPNDITQKPESSINDIISLNKDSNGNYSYKINYNKIGNHNVKPIDKKSGDRIAEVGGWLDLDVMGSNTSVKEDTSKIFDWFANAAKSIGIDPKLIKINTTDGKGNKLSDKEIKENQLVLNTIAKEYIKFSKNISPIQILSTNEPLREMTKDQIINGIGNYTIYEKDKVVTDDTELDNFKSFNPETREFETIRDEEGKAIGTQQVIYGRYTDSKGKRHELKLIPQSNESNSYYSIIGNVQNDVNGYFKNGIPENKEEIDLAQKELGIYNTPTREIISYKQYPGRPNTNILAVSNPNNRQEIQYYFSNKNTGEISPLGNANTFQNLVAKDWYATPEGKNEAIALNQWRFKLMNSQKK